MGRSTSSLRRSRCWRLILRSRFSFWWIGLWFRPENRTTHCGCGGGVGYREAEEIVFEIVSARCGGWRGSDDRWAVFGRVECVNCHRVYREPEPPLFSFNNPYGACARCEGFGNTIDFDLDRIIPDKSKTLNEGAIDPWVRPKYGPCFSELRKRAAKKGISAGCAVERSNSGAAGLCSRWRGSVSGVRGFFAHLERKNTSCMFACF